MARTAVVSARLTSSPQPFGPSRNYYYSVKRNADKQRLWVVRIALESPCHDLPTSVALVRGSTSPHGVLGVFSRRCHAGPSPRIGRARATATLSQSQLGVDIA